MSLLDAVCNTLTKHHINTAIPAGVFVSCMNREGEMQRSHGVILSTITLREQLQELIPEGNTSPGDIYVVDIVEKFHEISDAQSILTTSPIKYGFVLMKMDGTILGAMLPGVMGITTAKDAITAIKHKHNIGSQHVRIGVYTTSRHVIDSV